MSEWQPIKTAPKDGSYVVLTSDHPDWKYPFVARWNERLDNNCSAWWEFAEPEMNYLYDVSSKITHWMPLPTPQQDDRP